MRIENGRRYFIPAPMWLVTAALGMGGFGMRIAKKHVPEEHQVYMDAVDFQKLKKAMKELKKYKGLNLVDVKTQDGTEVKIIV